MQRLPLSKRREKNNNFLPFCSRRRERRDASLGLERSRRGVDLDQPRSEPPGEVGDLREREHARGDPRDLFFFSGGVFFVFLLMRGEV